MKGSKRVNYPRCTISYECKGEHLEAVMKSNSGDLGKTIRDGLNEIMDPGVVVTQVFASVVSVGTPRIIDVIIDVSIRTEKYSNSPEMIDSLDMTCDVHMDKILSIGAQGGSIKRLGIKVSCYGLPAIRVHYDAVNLIIPHNGTTLQGIEKLINCQVLRISDADSVTGHVLGILLIPDLKTFVSISGTSKLAWDTIIKKHLAGDRDILDCQEELRTAGLREFGKL